MGLVEVVTGVADAGTGLWATIWDAGHPCPVCAGHPGKRTKATKCTGGLRADGLVAYCTVSEATGKSLTHKLGGDCGCGLFHAKPPGGNGNAPEELNGYHHGPDGNPAFTDTRNAERFVERFGEHVRKDHTRGKRATEGWRIWDGTRWALDQTEVIVLRAKAVVADFGAEIETYRDTNPVAAPVLAILRTAALACESTGRLNALLQNAGSLVPATHETWDPDPYLLNCRNGTVDLRTGELLEHRPDRWQSKLAPVEYDPNCPTPVWDAFLARIFRGDADLVAFVQRAVGLSLVGKVLEHVLFVMYGGGGNGKGTFINVWLQIFGEYGRTAALDLFTETQSPQHPTSIAELTGVRFVATGEGRANRFDETIIKMLTGGDDRNARYMHQDSFVYTPADTFWLATNHQPSVSRISDGLKRRVRMIPFKVRIPDAEMDGDFLAKLRPEYPGILAWAVRGCLDWQEHGLGHASAVDAATFAYWEDMDTMATFLGDECVVEDGASVSSADLYKAYETWCEATGERPATQRFFGIRLGERQFERRKYGEYRRWYWFGLRLRHDGDLFDPDPGGGGSPRETTNRDLNFSESAATQPPERANPVESANPYADPSQSTPAFTEIKNDLGEPNEPINHVNPYASTGENSKSGSVCARAREANGLSGNMGPSGSPEIKNPARSVHAPNTAETSGGADCTLPARVYPVDANSCPECGGVMQHRPHAGHFDHDCRACKLRFRDL